MERGDGSAITIDEIGRRTHRLELIEDFFVTFRQELAHIGRKGEEQTQPCGEHTSKEEGVLSAARFQQVFGTANHLRQRQDSKQRDGEFCHNESGRNGAEFGIHRQVVDEEIRHWHQVFAPSEEQREDGGCEESPFHRAFHVT